MTTQEGLIAKCRENFLTQNYAPFLVYADWLEEHGNPQCDVIRLCVEIEQTVKKWLRDNGAAESTISNYWGIQYWGRDFWWFPEANETYQQLCNHELIAPLFNEQILFHTNDDGDFDGEAPWPPGLMPVWHRGFLFLSRCHGAKKRLEAAHNKVLESSLSCFGLPYQLYFWGILESEVGAPDEEELEWLIDDGWEELQTWYQEKFGKETWQREQQALSQLTSYRRLNGSLLKLGRYLRDNGFTSWTIEYDGYGDAGEFYDSLLVGPDSEHVLTREEPHAPTNHPHWNKKPYLLHHEAEDLLGEILQSYHSAWEINEGSFGSCFVAAADQYFRLEHNNRFSQSAEKHTATTSTNDSIRAAMAFLVEEGIHTAVFSGEFYEEGEPPDDIWDDDDSLRESLDSDNSPLRYHSFLDAIGQESLRALVALNQDLKIDFSSVTVNAEANFQTRQMKWTFEFFVEDSDFEVNGIQHEGEL